MKDWQRPPPPLDSGYWKLYVDHVLQADQGADLDFLVGNAARPRRVPTWPCGKAPYAQRVRPARQPLTPRLPRSRGGAAIGRQQRRKRLTARAGVFRPRADVAASDHPAVIGRRRHDDLETQDPHRLSGRVGDDLGVRRRRVVRRRSRRARRRRATRSFPRRAPAITGRPATGTGAATSTSGSTATGSVIVTATSITRRGGSRTATSGACTTARWDRDHDGVPNAVDAHPDNPRRP